MRGIAVAAMVFLMVVSASADAALRAGAARVDITPDVEALAPVVQGGYGARMGRPAQGVHDPIYARALAVSDGERLVCLLGLDLTSVPDHLPGDLLQALGAESGLDHGSLLITVTHTHSAPGNHSPVPPMIAAIFGAYNQRLYQFIREGAEQAVRQAIAEMKPAQVAVASRQLPGFNRNRREWRAGPVTDDEMVVLYAKTPEGGPIGMAVFYTAHPTVLGADNLLISGDWPGAMERAIEFALPGVVALHINGAEGDQSATGDFGGGFAFVQFYGAALAKHAVEMALAASAQAEVSVAAAWEEVQLPTPQVSPAFMETTGTEYNISQEAADALIRDLAVPSIPASAVRVGGLVIAAIPGEAIVEIGLGLKRRARDAGAEFAAVAGLAGRDVSYILTEEQYHSGGYEASMSFYGPRLGETIVAALGRLIEQVTK